MSYTLENAGTYKPAGGSTYLSTPEAWWNVLDREFHFTLDVAADDKNHMTEEYLTFEDDALKIDWLDYQVEPGAMWMAPPWSQKVIHYWAKKAALEASRGGIVVGLMPVRTNTEWWHKHVLKAASEIRFIDGQLNFRRMDNGVQPVNVQDACLIVWSFGRVFAPVATSYPSKVRRKR